MKKSKTVLFLILGIISLALFGTQEAIEKINKVVVENFVQVVFAGLIGIAFFEKGMSILENRDYSGKRATAYLLILVGIRQALGMFNWH